MADYEVGSIELSFKALSDETITSIEKTSKALRGLNTQINKIVNTDMQQAYKSFSQLTRIVTPFIDKIASASVPLQNFANAMDVSRANAQLERLNAQIDLTKAKIENVNARTELTKNKEVLNQKKIEQANLKLEKTKRQIDSIGNKSKKTKSLFGNLFNLGKIYFLFNYTKRFGQALGNIAGEAIDFEETLNKFQVSFGQFSNEATKFANQLTYAFNASTESIMNYMATFNSMLSSLGGLSGEASYGLSKTLTQLAIDYASLFNVSIDTAMQQFQSVLAGQIRSIRTTSGVDVSDLTIYQMYQELGGTKTQRQLSQLEKRLLRIYAIEKQMDSLGAIGDYQKTINSSANVLKQISETTKEWARWMGLIVMDYFKPLLTYSLAFMLVLKDITKAFAELKGLSTEEYDNNNKNSLFGSIQEGADDASESVNNLIGLLSFDKFEALKSSSSGGITDDLTNILSAIQNYGDTLANVKSEARGIADNILQWIGLVSKLNEETGETELVLEGTADKLVGIITLVEALIATGIIALIWKTVTATIALGQAIGITAVSLFSLQSSLFVLTSIGMFFLNYEKFTEGGRKIAGVLMIIGGALSFILGVIAAIRMSWLGPVGMLAGVAAAVAGIATISQASKATIADWQFFADGGFPTKGNVFIANEEGPELVGNIGGRTAVANNDMIVTAIENASYRGMSKAMAVQSGNKDTIEFSFSGTRDSSVARALSEPMINELKRQGYKVEKIN